jgi:hypothetical protein
VAEFGESVRYLKLDSAEKNKLERRWESGIWLGVKGETGESIIGAPEGVVKCRDFRRKPEGEAKWNSEELSQVRGSPWQPTPGRDSIEVKCQINMPLDNSPITEMLEGAVRGKTQSHKHSEGGTTGELQRQTKE